MAEVVHEFQVQPEEADERLDLFLSRRLPEVSRSAIQKWIAADRVRVDDEIKKASHRVSEAERVRAEPLPPEPHSLVAEEIPLEILHEDEEIVVLNKPAGQVVHPGAGNWTGTLANALSYHLQETSRSETIRPGIIHRLDKGTSGVLVVAKNDRAHEFIARQFAARTVEKRYLTLVFGRVEPSEGSIDLAIGRDRKARTKISARTSRPRPALTRYEVLRYLEDFSYLAVEPKTGRTHQIRVHLHHLGHPVVGDETYPPGKDELRRLPGSVQGVVRRMDRLFLHATSLTFVHPRTKERRTYEAPLPAELAAILKTLGE